MSITAKYWKFRNNGDLSFDILKNKKIWFSHPSNFNDPFDSLITPNDVLDRVVAMVLSRYPEEFTELEKIGLEQGILTGVFADLGLSEHMLYNYAYCCFCGSWDKDLMWAHYADSHKGLAYGFSSLESTGELIKNQYSLESKYQIEKPIKELMNLPKAKTQEIEDKREQFFRDLDVFGKESNDRFKKAADISLGLRNIDYIDTSGRDYEKLIEDLLTKVMNHQSVSNESSDDCLNVFSRIFNILTHTKSMSWADEYETRYSVKIEKENTKGVALPFDPSNLSDIIFGCRFNEEDKNKYIELLKSPDLKHVKVWKSSIDNEAMCLKLSPA